MFIQGRSFKSVGTFGDLLITVILRGIICFMNFTAVKQETLFLSLLDGSLKELIPHLSTVMGTSQGIRLRPDDLVEIPFPSPLGVYAY